MTNNVAEYYGLIAAMDYAQSHAIRALRIESDSETFGQADARTVQSEERRPATALRARPKNVQDLRFFPHRARLSRAETAKPTPSPTKRWMKQKTRPLAGRQARKPWQRTPKLKPQKRQSRTY